MRFFLSAVGLSLAAFVLIITPAQAQSQSDIAAALERMDAIIAEMQQLRTEFASLAGSVSATPSPSVLGVSTSGLGFTESLEYGATNDDIEYIQSLLATDPEIYPYGVASGFFGPKTLEAIKNFQSKMGLDPVGVIGPSTRAILEAFKAAYPTGAFPDNVLELVPTASAPEPSTPVTQTVVTTISEPTPAPVTAVNPISYIDAELDRGEAEVRIVYRNGSRERYIVTGETDREIARSIAERTGDNIDDILDALNVESEDSDTDHDEDDAEEAIEDADDAVDDADDEIDEADENDEEVSKSKQLLEEAEDALEDAEDAFDRDDWDEAVEKAEEAEELAEDAEDAIGEDDNERGDSGDIDEIQAEIEDEDETVVTVEYDDGSEYEFEVEEDRQDEIIEEVADELNIDEDEVEDLIEFEYGDVEEIEVVVDEEEGEAEVTVTYESGVKLRFDIDADSENDMIEEIADEIDEDEDDVDDWTRFDYS